VWLIWLLGVTSPVKACPRPQRFPTGLGASSVISSRNGPSRNDPNAGPASTSSQPIAPSDCAPESSSAKSSKAPRRRSPGNRSIQERNLNSLPEKPHDDFSVPPGISLGSMDCSRLTLAERMRKINSVKTATIHHPDLHHPISPQDEGSTRLLDASLNDYRFLFPMPSSLQSVPLRLPPPPVDSRDSAPVNLPFGAIPLPPRPVHPNPPSSSPQTSGIPYVTKVRSRNAVLGMPLDDNKVGGTRGSFSKTLEPPPSPSCSLVMETLPRKFRTESFIFDWLSQFPFKPRRYDLVEGKIFFEFETERDALLAWNSPRMGGLEGLFGVRLFWYRVLPQTDLKDVDTIRKVNVTGTIENSAQSRLQPVSDSSTDDFGHRLGHQSGFKADLAHSNILTQKAASPPLSRPPSTVIEEDSAVSVIDTPAEGSRSNSDTQKSRDTSEHFSGDAIVPSPTVATSPFAAPTALSDHPNDRMDAMIGDLPPGGVPGFIPGAAIAPPTIVFTSLYPNSSSSHTSPSINPTFSPEVVDPAFITTFADHQAPLALNQGLMQPSNSAAETLHRGMEVDSIEFEKVDGTPLGADDYMETTDAVALAKEQALREMVLRSRKRKLLDPPSAKQPTFTTTPTAASRSALEDLAANFIADAIARPRPAKIVKITPSSSAMAAWGKRLEQHVESSKAIMAKIQLTRSKAERNRLLAVLRDKDRCVSR
jgi:hypothetical protein